MLSLLTSNSVRLCDGRSRRELLRIGGLSALGLSLPHLWQGRASGKSAVRAKNCIILFLTGGPPQHSTWDPKPEAPAEIRGEFPPIATNVPGIQISSLFPRLATQVDKWCILRAVSTGDNAHSSSGYYMLTGVPHQPMQVENANPGAPNDWPFMGAIVRRLRGDRNGLPAAVRLPMHIFNTDQSVWPGQDAGFLGRAVDPWLFRCQPNNPEMTLAEFTLPENMDLVRLQQRGDLLRRLDRHLAELANRSTDRWTPQQAQAFDLLSSPRARAAFDLSSESPKLRDRYGRTHFGQSCLLARRLIEAGVSLVHVNWYRGPEEPDDAPVWDTHVQESNRLKNVLAPMTDQTITALVSDLADRGLLEETLVACLAEFGRTPRFNGRAGRDHWGPVFSVLLAGGGIRGGSVYGSSDKYGAYPQDGRVLPEELHATIYTCLGIDPTSELHDAQGRPFPISRGEPIRAILT